MTTEATRKHLDEEALILHYYGEEDAGRKAESAEHLAGCERCLEELAGLRELLDGLRGDERLDAPPAADLPERVWRAVGPRLELAGEGRSEASPRRWAWMAAAAAVVLASTFLAGRLSTRWVATDVVSGDAVREGILLVALGDHLERSQWVLLELANERPDAEGWSIDPVLAQELVRESRLYRQTAERVGDVAAAEVLEQLERLLLDVAQGPQSAPARSAVQDRLEENDLLFKVRVLKTAVESRQAGAGTRRF